MKALVIGATGQYAKAVVPELLKRGATVRALVRDDRSAGRARAAGAQEAAVGDLSDPPSLRAAAVGVDGVFHINPAFAPNEAELGVAMVEAARAAGVRRFVFSGAIHPSISRMANHANKRPVEEALYESGMAFTVLQPTMFMQTLANGWPAVVKTGAFGLPFDPAKRSSYVDYRDVAEAAAVGLTSDRLAYGTFELSAAGMVDRHEAAALMALALGRPVVAATPTFDEWAAAASLPAGPRRDGMRAMYADYDRYGFPGGNPLVLTAILGREPRTLRQFLAGLATTA